MAIVLVVALSGVVSAGPPPRPGESHVPYEMGIFPLPNGPQKPGTHLNAPGDTYRFTYIINDKYSNDPNYVLVRTAFGVHVLDPEYTKAKGDGPKEYGRILIDGKPREYLKRSYAYKNLKESEKKGAQPFMEMASDPETGGAPPYIYDIIDQVKDDNKVVLEITNVRADGSIDGNAAYGDFTVLRAGLHCFYKKK